MENLVKKNYAAKEAVLFSSNEKRNWNNFDKITKNEKNKRNNKWLITLKHNKLISKCGKWKLHASIKQIKQLKYKI